ncbi:5-oxoprolinase subunit PxpA [Microbacterium oryzae]|uniref:LamB/YcsF family protein n=1 Tax=Microbacterium oryzae TaxID=743009 RepID=UPI0025AF36F8|nr:5-oxoprolinase subunit PxpA [Microbacterium oryzae]MDN3310739.1 5-oxoprolinase subunit PxpA [Microbacterium oryzae]
MIDLNSDLGENAPGRVVSDDEAMLDVVTSANVSCGAHAGTPRGIRATLTAAACRGVAVGAHPGYRDREGFGRRSLDVSAAALQADLEVQLADLSRMAGAARTRVRYVKPHGALYNDAVVDATRARTIVAAIRAVDPTLPVLGLAGSVLLDEAARAGLGTATEAFADRAYLPSGALVPRGEPDAVLHDADEVAQRMARLVRDGAVTAADGTVLRVRADSICVHGDSPGAVAMAAAVRRVLEAEGIPIAPFAP